MLSRVYLLMFGQNSSASGSGGGTSLPSLQFNSAQNSQNVCIAVGA